MSNKGISDYLLEQQKLTKQNLEILKGINEAWYSKKQNISFEVDGETYTLPSFLCLESKINSLQDNFENLVNAPLTGDAVFDFNGNTQEIEVKSFSNTPKKALSDDLQQDSYTSFGYKTNSIFKDFCSPKPYIKIELSDIPTDISNVVIKKIIPIHEDLKTFFENKFTESDLESVNTCSPIQYSDMVKYLYNYEKDTDYTEYDTVSQLPIRVNDASGNFVIKSITKNWIEEDLTEYYTVELDTLFYKLYDETTQKQLKAGDTLVTNNDKIKLTITDIKSNNNQITLYVDNGGYADLCDSSSTNSDLYTLKYFNNSNFDNYKYVEVPLEEDQYIAIFISPISRTGLIRAPYGNGLIFNVFNLTCDVNGTTYYYKDYYNNFVRNIGDVLYGLTDVVGDDFVNFTSSKYTTLTSAVPVLSSSDLEVVELNKHLNDSTVVSELYKLYNQKQTYKNQLSEVQANIDSVQSILNELVFTDTSQNRSIYESQLATYKKQKEDINNSISSIISEINTKVNDSETPVNDPKYRIRGFFDYTTFINNLGLEDIHISKIEVQYRYKNPTKSTGNAITINSGIFSDWCLMDSIYNIRKPSWVGVQNGLSYDYEENNTNVNEISFNQIDIPISQGETVDIRVRVLYANGQPFVNLYSDWSEILNVEFPSELKRNTSIEDIIETNNDDSQTNNITTLLKKEGITTHVDDEIVDQNITYFHQPDHIASGFYTDERRVIPLKTKLEDMYNDIVKLQDEISGTSSELVEVTLADSSAATTIYPMSTNTFLLEAYNNTDASQTSPSTDLSGCVYKEQLTLTIKNTSSSHTVKLYPVFPGSNDIHIDSKTTTKYNNIEDYYVPVQTIDKNSKPTTTYITPQILDNRIFGARDISDGNTNISDIYNLIAQPQRKNAFISFRSKDLLTGEMLYDGICDATSAYYVISEGVRLLETDNKLFGRNADFEIKEIDGLEGLHKYNYNSILFGQTLIYLAGQSVNLSYTLAALYPIISSTSKNSGTWTDLCIPNGQSYITLNPNESVSVYLMWESLMRSDNKKSIEKTISFDIRTSLYSDPTNYQIKVKQNKESQLSDILLRSKNKSSSKYNSPIV